MPDSKITEKDLDLAAAVGTLMERTKTIMDDVGTLRHVLIEGNGVPPITVQVATLVEQNKGQDKQIEDLKAERKQSRGDKTVIWAALITASVPLGEMILRWFGVIGKH